jgi:hypothetical protein
MSKTMRNFVSLFGVLGVLLAVGCGGGSDPCIASGAGGKGSEGDGAAGDGPDSGGSGGSSSATSGSSSSGSTSSGGGLHWCTSQDLDGSWQVEATGSDPIYWQCDTASSSCTLSAYAELTPVQSPPQFDEDQWAATFSFATGGLVTFQYAAGACPALPTNSYTCVALNGLLAFTQQTGANKGAMITWVKNPPPPPVNVVQHCGP